MRPKLSEFSYGYAITNELVNSYGTPLRAAPVFPSLIAEGRAGGGYDLRLDRPGIPLFLQFKLSDYIKMINRRIQEVRENYFQTPFYRMHLRASRDSAQHRLLLALENQGNEVYYVAPAFYEEAEFNRLYFDRDVVSKSVWISPAAIGPLPDDRPHHVAFQLPGNSYLLSEPNALPSPINFENFTKQITASLRDSRYRSVAEYLPDLVRQMQEIISHQQPYQSRLNIELRKFIHLSSLQRVALLAHLVFDCQMFIVQMSET